MLLGEARVVPKICPKCGHKGEDHTVYGVHFIDDLICTVCLKAFMSGAPGVQTISKCPLNWQEGA